MGSIVDGRFRIVRLLGRGGMGSVYEAVNVRIGKRVAIKLLEPELAQRDEEVRRFMREARIASRIGHRNVVDIHDFGQLDGGLVYYVMEYLEGRDLARVLADSGRMRWPRARSILLQIVRGLKAAHDAKVVHRDIKPANVFLVAPSEDEPEQRVKVLDFGIAKADCAAAIGTEVLTGMGGLVGTAWYMAPERALGKGASVASDVYGVGVLMYQVLAGRVPFADTETFAVLLRHVNETPRSLREHAPDVPQAVAEIVHRCLAKEPRERFACMRSLEHALSSIGVDGGQAEPSTLPPARASNEPIPPPLIRPPAPEPEPPPTLLAPSVFPPRFAMDTAVLDGVGRPERMEKTQYLALVTVPPKTDEDEEPTQRLAAPDFASNKAPRPVARRRPTLHGSWLIVAAFAGAAAVGLGGWVALLLTQRTAHAQTTPADPEPAHAAPG